MKTLNIAVITIIGLCTMSVAGNMNERTIAETFKAAFAESVKAENGTLQFMTKESGARFLFSVDGSPQRVLHYKESIILPRGFKRASFTERHYSITITKMDGNGERYELVEKFDQRSFGGELTTSSKEFTLDDASLIEPKNE